MTDRIEVPWTYRYAEMMNRLDDDGLLLASTKTTGESNTMTIGWGTVGIVWGLPIFAVLVRPSRFTYEFIEDCGDFTVNVPTPDMSKILEFCGTKSGRDYDKFAEFRMSITPGKTIGSVNIDRCLWVYECKVVQKNDFAPVAFAASITPAYYPSGDFHRVYYGEILGVYAHADDS